MRDRRGKKKKKKRNAQAEAFMQYCAVKGC